MSKQKITSTFSFFPQSGPIVYYIQFSDTYANFCPITVFRCLWPHTSASSPWLFFLLRIALLHTQPPTHTHTNRNICLSYIFVSFLEIHNGCSLITNHFFLSSFNLALPDKHHPFRWRVRPLRERPISSSTVQPDAGDLSDPRRSAGHPNGFISR